MDKESIIKFADTLDEYRLFSLADKFSDLVLASLSDDKLVDEEYRLDRAEELVKFAEELEEEDIDSFDEFTKVAGPFDWFKKRFNKDPDEKDYQAWQKDRQRKAYAEEVGGYAEKVTKGLSDIVEKLNKIPDASNKIISEYQSIVNIMRDVDTAYKEKSEEILGNLAEYMKRPVQNALSQISGTIARYDQILSDPAGVDVAELGNIAKQLSSLISKKEDEVKEQIEESKGDDAGKTRIKAPRSAEGSEGSSSGEAGGEVASELPDYNDELQSSFHSGYMGLNYSSKNNLKAFIGLGIGSFGKKVGPKAAYNKMQEMGLTTFEQLVDAANKAAVEGALEATTVAPRSDSPSPDNSSEVDPEYPKIAKLLSQNRSEVQDQSVITATAQALAGAFKGQLGEDNVLRIWAENGYPVSREQKWAEFREALAAAAAAMTGQAASSEKAADPAAVTDPVETSQPTAAFSSTEQLQQSYGGEALGLMNVKRNPSIRNKPKTLVNYLFKQVISAAAQQNKVVNEELMKNVINALSQTADGRLGTTGIDRLVLDVVSGSNHTRARSSDTSTAPAPKSPSANGEGNGIGLGGVLNRLQNPPNSASSSGKKYNKRASRLSSHK